MRRGQPHKCDQARLRHGRAGGQRNHRHQRQTQLRHLQTQALRRVLPQRQAIEQGRERCGGEQADRKRQRHDGAGRPADKTGAAQHEGLHHLHDVRAEQQDERGHRAQHHTHHHPGQQEPQCLLNATGQQQGQQHAGRSPEKRGAGEAHACQPVRGQR